MELHQLRQFVTIAQSGSISAAADRLFLSQPALSQNLKKLERELGVTLFDRSRTPLRLTEYGEIVLVHAERALFQVSDMAEQVAALKRANAQTVRVGCFYNVVAYSGMPIIADALKDISFRVCIEEERSIIAGLDNGRFDIGILPGKRPLSGTQMKTLAEERLFVVLPVSSPYARNESVSLDDLASISLVLPIGMLGISSWYEDVVALAGVDESRITRLPAIEYFSFLERPDSAHLRTSLVSASVDETVAFRHIPICAQHAIRKITAYYPDRFAAENPRIRAYFESWDAERFGAHAALPHLLRIRNEDNLSFEG